MIVTRFAPSPTGYLHLGHAASALTGWTLARWESGRFLLRIEDIDRNRCREAFDAAISEDLAWLGLDWEQPVRRQSQHMADYRAALARLDRLGLLYPCFCTRKDIAAAVSAPHGPDGPFYPGTCRGLAAERQRARIDAGQSYAMRLDVAKAAALTGPLAWREWREGTITVNPGLFGDVVLARKDIATSYHLAVTVDDDLQGVTLVTRGRDLFEATHLHRLLQALLGLAEPDYHHHPLLTDESGRRLAKRDDARSIRALRDAGHTPEQVRSLAGFPGWS
jgi:glutamyl-Q tRNA(Asp) synthetase